jgi:Bacterial Ig-like domain
MTRHRRLLLGALLCAAMAAPHASRAELGCAPGTGAPLTDLVDEIAALPEGGWLRVNANRYDEVWTPVELRSPSGALLSTPSKIIQAWSSFAWDCRRGDLLLYGGGHANYSGNDTYRWRATTRRWERMSLPSDIRVDGMGNTTAIDGPFAAPPAAHTYDNNIYLPYVDRFLVLGGSAWNNGGAYEMETGPGTERITGPYVFDLNKADGSKVGGTTGSHVQSSGPHPEIVGGMMWHNRDIHTLLPASTLPQNHTSGTTAYAGTANADVVLLTARQGLGTAQHLFRYEITDAEDATQDKVSRIGRFVTGTTGRGAGAYDPDLNVFVRTTIGSSSAIFFYWDLAKAGYSNPNVIFTPRDLTGSWALDRGYGMDFDPVRGQYLLWGGTGEVWTLRAPANVSPQGWTIARLPPPPTVETPTSDYDGASLQFGGGVLGKWKYIPQLDAFVGLQDTAAGNVWIYKPAGWVRPGTTAPPTLNFDLTPERIFAGDPVTLAWRTQGAESCVADGGWTGAKSTRGSQQVAAVQAATEFGLRCTGPGGSIRRTVAVAVDPLAPPTIAVVGTDGCVNAAETSTGLTFRGSAKPGATVTVTVSALSRSTVTDAQGQWAVALTGAESTALPEGALTVSARQAVGAFTSASTALAFSKDTVAPTATSSAPILAAASDTGSSSTDGRTRDATPTYEGTASLASAQVVLLLDGVAAVTTKADAGGKWKATARTLPGGNYLVSAAVADTCGNRGPASTTVPLLLDLTAPAATLGAIAADNRINAQEAGQGIAVRGSAEAQSAVTLRISSGGVTVYERQAVSGGAFEFALSAVDTGALPDGALVFAVTATDDAGNVRTVKRTVPKDTVVARPVLFAIAGDDVLTAAERAAPVVVAGTAEPKATVTLTVNGWTREKYASSAGDWSMEVPTTVLGGLPAGPVPFVATATDTSGNVSGAASRTVTVSGPN